MNDAPTDSMFKLRLPGQLREKLERDAQAKGRTLTGEILERLTLSLKEPLETTQIFQCHIEAHGRGLVVFPQAFIDTPRAVFCYANSGARVSVVDLNQFNMTVQVDGEFGEKHVINVIVNGKM